MHEDVFQKLLNPCVNPAGKSQILSFTTLKELEAIEMLQEEKCISNLKLQREKVLEFQQVIAEKEKKIKELETEVRVLSTKKGESEKQAAEIIGLAQNLKRLEIENSKLKLTINSQSEEYENSINELKQVVMREREEKNNEMRLLKLEIEAKDEDLESLMKALEKAKANISSLEKKTSFESHSAREKEKSANDQIKFLKSNEKKLKDEVLAIKQENAALKENLKKFSEEVCRSSEAYEEMEVVKKNLAEEKRKNKEMTKLYAETTEKYEKLKKNIDEEFLSLKEELDQAVEIITRQEVSLQDLRKRKKEDESRMIELGNENELRQQEIIKLQMVNSKIMRKDEENSEKISDLEYRIKSILSENSQFKMEIARFKEAQEKERLERKKIARKKLDLLTQRNAEITRLTEAFTSFEQEY